MKIKFQKCNVCYRKSVCGSVVMVVECGSGDGMVVVTVLVMVATCGGCGV